MVVGVNRYRDQEDRAGQEILRIAPRSEQEQAESVQALRAGRDPARVRRALDDVRAAAEGTDNLLPPMREALRAYATIGEVCGVLREVFGEYRPGVEQMGRG